MTSLNYMSAEATQVQNTAGTMTPILEISPEDGLFFRFLNRVDRGSASGLPVFMKLYSDASGTEMPNDTAVQLLAKRAQDSRWKPVSFEESSLSTWRENSLKEQRSEDHIDAVKVELKGERVNIRDIDEFAVGVESSAVIDWTDSELYFYGNGVVEKQKED